MDENTWTRLVCLLQDLVTRQGRRVTNIPPEVCYWGVSVTPVVGTQWVIFAGGYARRVLSFSSSNATK